MVTQNTYPNLSNIVHTDFELGRVIQTVTAADPGITEPRGTELDLLRRTESLSAVVTNIPESHSCATDGSS